MDREQPIVVLGFDRLLRFSDQAEEVLVFDFAQRLAPLRIPVVHPVDVAQQLELGLDLIGAGDAAELREQRAKIVHSFDRRAEILDRLQVQVVPSRPVVEVG